MFSPHCFTSSYLIALLPPNPDPTPTERGVCCCQRGEVSRRKLTQAGALSVSGLLEEATLGQLSCLTPTENMHLAHEPKSIFPEKTYVFSEK